MPHKIRLAVGIATAVLVQVLAKGHWAHAVWLPALIMLSTDLEKVVGGQEVGQILDNQRVRFLLGAGAAVAVELLAKGPWAHAVWLPTVAMLLTDTEKVFSPQVAPAATPAPATTTTPSSEAVTPRDVPPK